ncbi:uncharacterized protein LOC121761223 isoform X2 [Salvia splendens]|uniref:uncharacterized protein LOC121761223 isoform X1 n=2 Tax=Salvia splendens TaxID=180675 RepID=UPI001C2569EE|nr:uncharacterized protein LOC121761223 isoform X1 [Salvia splendens]XP_042012793.1 uncharacterized protein LOC121761223 isoform X2 [Salvia splendens]XP_042012801.1 uncharacterized protein LOC121761223 isoform X2 [Salvia splendens]
MCEGSILSEVYIVFACLMKLKGLVSKHLSVSQLRGITRGRSYCLADIINVSMIFLRDGTMQIAYCDAGAILDEDFSSVMQSPQVGSSYVDAAVGDNYGKSFSTGNALVNELRHGFKQYDIQLKPLFSAFHWKNLGLTSLRSFMLFYLPLLEPRPPTEDEDDEDFLAENPIEHHVDLVEPFKKSVIQIIRETSVVTTRRILERLAVHYASQRIAWKLLKDVPKSAIRKASRKLPTCTLCFCVSRTTFRGHLLGDAASWAVQVGLDMYGFIYCTAKSKKDIHETTHMKDEFKILGKKVYGTTVRCAASLVFASVGAGIGATLIHPSTGQWVGCALGDLGGPIIIALCFEKLRWVL